MYFAVTKIIFEFEGETKNDRKDIQNLCEKIRAKHRVSVMPILGSDMDRELAVAIASLAQSEASLSKQLDAISKLCEESGIGRIRSEKTLMDHIDSFGEEE